MWRALPPARLLTALALGLLAASSAAAASGPREHPRGVWGQDELRRSIRQLENDWDRLMEAWDRSVGALKGTEEGQAEAREELLSIDAELDDLRDGYAERSREETLEAVDALLPRRDPLFEQLRLLEPPERFRAAWNQVHVDFKRLGHELETARGGERSLLYHEPDPDRLKVAVAEIEDLSDELKRYLLRTDAEESDYETHVTKAGGGRARYRVHDVRLERAVLDFEVAADELKTMHRKHERPRGTRPLIDRLARAARTIDFSMGEESTPAEARREWREIVPELEYLLDAYHWRGIGTGWESHR